MSTLPSLLPMAPYFRPVIWGGRRLREHYRKSLPPGVDIGESFELSAIPEMNSSVASGPLEGALLQTLIDSHGADLLGQSVVDRYGTEFPLLIKLLDANDDLSIQVHPDDIYARAHDLGTYGKMEAWYVLRSDNGRVASGLKAGVGPDDFRAAIDEARVEDAVEFHSVSPGDVIFLAPGAVHALCSGVMVYEVQQSSSLTFRIYDYNRPGTDGKPRELHRDRSLDVIDFSTGPIVPAGAQGEGAIVESEHFRLERYTTPQSLQYPAFAALTAVTGSAHMSAPDGSLDIGLGETVLIPSRRAFDVTPASGSEYLVSTVP